MSLNIRDNYKKLIMSQGLEVGANTIRCELWHEEEHENCIGCPSELGCGKYVKLMLLHMIPVTFQPKTFSDHQNMINRIQELSKMVLDAKTPKELQNIPNI